MQVPIFTIISGLNGYKSLSNEVYYPVATTAGLIEYWRASDKYIKLPLEKKLYYKSPGHLVVCALATGLSMTLSGITGHYMGRAIKEVLLGQAPALLSPGMVLEPQSISLPVHPSSPHNGA